MNADDIFRTWIVLTVIVLAFWLALGTKAILVGLVACLISLVVWWLVLAPIYILLHCLVAVWRLLRWLTKA